MIIESGVRVAHNSVDCKLSSQSTSWESGKSSNLPCRMLWYRSCLFYDIVRKFLPSGWELVWGLEWGCFKSSPESLSSCNLNYYPQWATFLPRLWELVWGSGLGWGFVKSSPGSLSSGNVNNYPQWCTFLPRVWELVWRYRWSVCNKQKCSH